LRYRVTRLVETHALHRADAVTTICEGLRADVIGRGVAGDKITVIPNAVDRSTFKGAGVPDRALQTWLGLCGKTVLAFFGSFYSSEGLDLLLRAVPNLQRYRPNIAVLLVGGGPEESNLRTLAQQLDLGDDVVFAGRVPHEEMQRYYDLADLFVFPRI